MACNPGPLRALAAAWLAGAAFGARAGDLAGRADLSLGDERLELGTNRYFRQRYDLELSQPVSEMLRYGLRLRLQEERGESTVGPDTTSALRRAASARGDGAWTLQDAGLFLRYELDWAGEEDPIGPGWHERRLQRSSTGGRLRPSGPLELQGAWEHTDARSSASTRLADRAQAGAELSFPGFRLNESNAFQRTQDGPAERIAWGPRVGLDWNRQLGPDTTLAARYQGDWTWSVDRSLSRATVQVPVGVAAIAGLFAWTDLPADTTSTPMVATPALVDGNFVAGAGIPIGPTGVWFQNVGLDLGRVAVVDELRITIRSSTGNLVPFGGSVTWTTWWSNDGARWVRAGGDITSYDVTLGAYAVSCTPITARFVKVVNDATHPLDAGVTELQAFVHETLRPAEERRARSTVQSVSLVASARPAEWLRLSYAGTLNASGGTAGVGPTGWSTDTSHALSAVTGPFGPLTLNVSLSDWELRQLGELRTRNLGAAATATWRLAPLADVAASARVSELTQDAVSALVWGGGLRGALAWYGALRLDGGVDFTRQELDAGSADYVAVTAGASARPSPGLELSAGASLQRSTSTRGPTEVADTLPLLVVYEYERYQVGVTWRTAPQLQLDLRVGAVHPGATYRFAESLRVLWNPLRDAAFQVAADYANEVDPTSGRTYQRIQIAPRWMLNRHATLQVYYSRQRISGDVASAQDAVYLTFSVRT